MAPKVINTNKNTKTIVWHYLTIEESYTLSRVFICAHMGKCWSSKWEHSNIKSHREHWLLKFICGSKYKWYVCFSNSFSQKSYHNLEKNKMLLSLLVYVYAFFFFFFFALQQYIFFMVHMVSNILKLYVLDVVYNKYMYMFFLMVWMINIMKNLNLTDVFFSSLYLHFGGKYAIMQDIWRMSRD